MGMGNMNQATLEVNPSHPIIAKLKAMIELNSAAPETDAFGSLVYDVAALASGYTIEDPALFASRINGLMSSGQGGMPEPAEAEKVEAELVE